MDASQHDPTLKIELWDAQLGGWNPTTYYQCQRQNCQQGVGLDGRNVAGHLKTFHNIRISLEVSF